MKNLWKVSVLLVLMLALLCGCAAAGTSSDSTTEGTQAEEKTGPYELTYTYVASSPVRIAEAYKTASLIIRTVDEINALCDGSVPESLTKYDDAFFEDHSLIAVQVSGVGSGFYAIPGRMARRSDGVYTLRVYGYIPEIVETVVNYDTFLIEVDEALPADAQLQIFEDRGTK